MSAIRIVAALGVSLTLACGEAAPSSSNDRDERQDESSEPSHGDVPSGSTSSRDAGGRRDATVSSGDVREDGGQPSAPMTGSTRDTRDAGADASARPDAAGDASAGPSSGASDAAAWADAASDSGSPLSSDAGQNSGNAQGPIAALAGKTMYSSKPTGAATWLVDADAAAMQRLIEADMRAAGANRFPVFSLYRYFPNSGANAASHRTWVTSIAETIGRAGGPAVVVLEPDAFALGTNERPDVDAVLNTAIGILKDKAPNAALFLDIGHSNWHPAGTVLSRAKAFSNYARIDGWASNTSNFQPMQAEINFARALHAGSNKPVIIDSSRNGRGTPPRTIFNPPDSEWDPGPPFAFHPQEPAVLFNYYNKPSNERD